MSSTKVVDITLQDGQILQYDGSLPLYQDYAYTSEIPGLTSGGKPKPHKKLWWEAQCIFRGLDATGTIAVLEKRLEGHHEKPMTDEITKAVDNIVQRASSTPVVRDSSNIDADVVMGGTADHAVEDEDEDEDEDDHPNETAAQRKKREKMSTDLDKGKDWDVTGTWHIVCEEVMDQWPDTDPQKMQMTIYRKATAKGLQWFAKFEFGVVAGFMRFVIAEKSPTLVAAAAEAAKTGQKSKFRNEDGEDTEDSDAGSDELEGYHFDDFDFPADAEPSSTRRDWFYRWRGEDTGEGDIQLDEDCEAYPIHFYGKKGRKVKGTIGVGFFGCNAEFTGEKVKLAGKKAPNIDREWHERGFRGYTWNGKHVPHYDEWDRYDNIRDIVMEARGCPPVSMPGDSR